MLRVSQTRVCSIRENAPFSSRHSGKTLASPTSPNRDESLSPGGLVVVISASVACPLALCGLALSRSKPSPGELGAVLAKVGLLRKPSKNKFPGFGFFSGFFSPFSPQTPLFPLFSGLAGALLAVLGAPFSGQKGRRYNVGLRPTWGDKGKTNPLCFASLARSDSLRSARASTPEALKQKK